MTEDKFPLMHRNRKGHSGRYGSKHEQQVGWGKRSAESGLSKE